MTKLLELLENKRVLHHLGGALIDEIATYEQNLGLRFSDEYREYLLKYGEAIIEGHVLTGICNTDSRNVYRTTIKERMYNTNIPLDMYLIEYTGMESMTIWQNSIGEIYEVAYKCPPRKIFDSLHEYLINT